MESSFNSEGAFSRFSSIVTMLVFTLLGVYFVLQGNLKAILFGFFLVGACVIWWAWGLYTVSFMGDFFIINRRFKSKKIRFSQINSFYKNREGFAPIYVYVVKYTKQNGRVGKITFDANKMEADEVLKKINQVNPEIRMWVKE